MRFVCGFVYLVGWDIVVAFYFIVCGLGLVLLVFGLLLSLIASCGLCRIVLGLGWGLIFYLLFCLVVVVCFSIWFVLCLVGC